MVLLAFADDWRIKKACSRTPWLTDSLVGVAGSARRPIPQYMTYSASMMPAAPMPVPMHMVTMPYFC